MRMRALVLVVVSLGLMAAGVGTASAAQFDQPSKASPAWFTQSFKQQVDAAGPQGVPMGEHSVLDVCPGAAIRENAVGTGACLVYPYGCTANFVYYNGGGATAPARSDGHLYLGSAGHCSDKVGQEVYAAVSTPGVGPSIAKIGTVSKRVEKYPDGGNVHDFEAIQLDPGFDVYPDSPVGGPQGIDDSCQVGQPVKYYGHGYEIAVAQGKPEGGVIAHMLADGFGWVGLAFGGDSGSGVINAATNEAEGDLTAIAIVYPPYAPGEVIGSRMTWILSFLGSGYSLVNADRTLSRDTTNDCQTAAPRKGGGRGKKPRS